MNILDQTLISHLQSATSPPHATVLKLDTKIRSCAIPAKLQLKDAGARTQADDMLLLQHYTSMVGKRIIFYQILTRTYSYQKNLL